MKTKLFDYALGFIVLVCAASTLGFVVYALTLWIG